MINLLKALIGLSCAVTTSPTPIAKFTASGLRTNEVVGYSVATDGQLVLIGTGAGSAFLYDPFTKQQLAKFTVPDPRFDTSVALQGNLAVVGTRVGAYVFDFSDLLHISSTQLIPEGGPVELFGVSVDISGDTIIVGANGENSAGSFTGAAYLFNKNTHAQFAKLTANDKHAGDNFGISVAIDGNSAVIGSALASSGGSDRRGAVYLFDADPGFVGNRQIAKYSDPPGNPALHPQFGYNVDIADDAIVAIEPINGQSFVWPTSGSPMPLPLSVQDRNSGDALSIQDGRAIVGIPSGNRANIYDVNRSPLGIVDSPEAITGFGFSVALAGNLVVVGATGTPEHGAAYVYLLQDLIPEPSTCALVSLAFVVIACHRRSYRGPAST